MVLVKAPGAMRSMNWPSHTESISVHTLKGVKWPNRVGGLPSSAARISKREERTRSSLGGLNIRHLHRSEFLAAGRLKLDAEQTGVLTLEAGEGAGHHGTHP